MAVLFCSLNHFKEFSNVGLYFEKSFLVFFVGGAIFVTLLFPAMLSLLVLHDLFLWITLTHQFGLLFLDKTNFTPGRGVS